MFLMLGRDTERMGDLEPTLGRATFERKVLSRKPMPACVDLTLCHDPAPDVERRQNERGLQLVCGRPRAQF
jgi:hypothetical protein